MATKENTPLVTLTVDVAIQPNGNFDVYLSHEGGSGEHYKNVTADKIGELVAEDVEIMAESFEAYN